MQLTAFNQLAEHESTPPGMVKPLTCVDGQRWSVYSLCSHCDAACSTYNLIHVEKVPKGGYVR
jgi:hypothetical protein